MSQKREVVSCKLISPNATPPMQFNPLVNPYPAKISLLSLLRYITSASPPSFSILLFFVFFFLSHLLFKQIIPNENTKTITWRAHHGHQHLTTGNKVLFFIFLFLSPLILLHSFSSTYSSRVTLPLPLSSTTLLLQASWLQTILHAT